MCEDDIPITKEQMEQFLDIMRRYDTPKKRLEAIGCKAEEVKTPHGTITFIKNKWFKENESVIRRMCE